MATSLDKSQVATRVGYFGQLNDATALQAHLSSTYLIIRAGFPTTTARAGTSLVTTAPAPIIAHSPMVMPQRMVALAPMEAPFRTTVRRSSNGCLLRGNRSFVKV